MPVSRLIFFPEDTHQITDYKKLVTTLVNSGLIQSQAHSENHYLPGDNFLSLLTFLGCSPNINITPSDNEDHCFISLIPVSEKAKCLGFTRTAKPKCPSCTRRIANWETEHWQQHNQTCLCDKCQTKTLYADLNWKQECGFGQCGFEIAHIYPHEAVPGEQLLNALEQYSGFKWQYCYANN